MQGKLATTEPYIWLQSFEPEGTADCGCTLVSDHDDSGDPAYFQCSFHAAAQDMLRIVRMVAGLPDDAARRNGCSALVEDARAILSTLAKVGA